MISSGIYLIGCLIYWFWASGEVQPWAEKKTEESRSTDIKKTSYTNEALEMKE